MTKELPIEMERPWLIVPPLYSVMHLVVKPLKGCVRGILLTSVTVGVGHRVLRRARIALCGLSIWFHDLDPLLTFKATGE